MRRSNVGIEKDSNSTTSIDFCVGDVPESIQEIIFTSTMKLLGLHKIYIIYNCHHYSTSVT